MEEKVVGGQDQMPGLDVLGSVEEAISQTRRGVLQAQHWQAFVEHRNPFGVKLATRRQASQILGMTRFLHPGHVVPAWNRLISERRTDHSISSLKALDSLPIRYTEETLREVAQDRAWYLVYDPGFSLRDKRALLGTDRDHQPCHYPGNNWWLSQEEDKWAAARAEPAYHLVRMEGLFPCDEPQKNWDWQEEQIRQMGEMFYRAPSRVVGNACITCFLLNSQQRHLETCYHWGPEQSSDGYFVGVGHFDCRGFRVGHWYRDGWSGRLRVCVARKFDA